MFKLSNAQLYFGAFLILLGMPAWADGQANSQQKNELCFFYEFIKGSTELSDPASQVSYFIKGRWIELENDLARGYGDELTYLRGLAMCPYVLPEKLWENQIKGLPYEQRASVFTKSFSSTCFCTW
ncbi:MAG: hypothetical protein HOP21_08365 [Methylotenera sp.]|nr:hypothetical protein [Methylotenera sp.]